MAALPIVKFDAGFVEVERGALFDCPAEFFAAAQMAFYAACKPGWNRCPLGYDTYAALDAMGRKFVVPGNITPGEKAPNRKFPAWQIRFPRNSIEKFLKPHLGVSEEIKGQRDTELKNLTHDLRAISNEIYHTALTAKQVAEERSERDLAANIAALIDAQQMMSIRLDIVDYESGHSASRPKELISVFKKTEKVLKCFSNRMLHRKLRYRIDGRQFSNTFGPPIFEIIPFVVVENAVKYAPNGTEIFVRFEESETDIITRFESIGPKIKEAEKNKVFEQHFRGDAAKKSERSGSGIGLYAAKTLLETQFGGNIYVNQVGAPLWYNEEEYFNTRFTVVVPIAPQEKNVASPRPRRRFGTFGRRP